MILAQGTFTIRRLAKDELNLVFSSDTVAIPSKNGVADLSTAEFGVEVLKGGRDLFPVFDEEIGGRNYILNSDIELSGSGLIFMTPINNAERLYPLIGKTITISLDIRADEPIENVDFYLRNNSNSSIISGSGSHKFNVSESFDRYSHSFELVDITELTNIGFAIRGGDKVSKYRRNIKLEKGNKATDWTPAPEEILANATLSAHNCTAVVDGNKIKITSIEDGKDAGYVDVTVSYGEGNNVTRRFTWARAETGVSITKVDVEFAVNTNKTIPPTSEWDTLAPTSLTAIEQLWTRTVTYLSKGGPNYSLPANITPQIGQGVESIVEEFAISTFKDVQPTTGWDTTPPTWSSGNYIWSRVKVTYKNPTEIKYTGYAVSAEWEAVNELETKVDAAFDVVNDSITAVANRTTTLEDTTGSLTIRMASAEQKITPDSIVSTVTSSTKYTSNLGSKTYFAKPAEYKRGDRWVLTEDIQLIDNLYLKGQMLEAVYESGEDSDWRLMLIEGDEEATEGINLIRNYDFREGFAHWGAIEGSIVDLDDELPTEFYTSSINVIGDEYGYEYAITSENDELIILDE